MEQPIAEQPVKTPHADPRTLIYGLALISVMGVSITLPVLPLMGGEFGLSGASLGILVASFTLPGMLLAPVIGILADRLGRKTILVPCLCLFALGGLEASLSRSLTSLLCWRAVQGCGAACLGVLYNLIIADVFPDEKARLRIMGYAATVLSMGTAIYPALGGFLGEWGWRPPLFLSLLALPLAGLALLTDIPPLKQRPHSMAAYARKTASLLLRPHSIGHFLITLCAFSILAGPMITYFPLLAHDDFAASPSRIGGIFAMASLGTALSSWLLGRFSRTFPPRALALPGALLFCLSMALMPLARGLDSVWYCFVPILLYGLGQGLVYPLVLHSLSVLAPSESRGIVMAVNGTVQRLAQTVSPPLCGVFFLLGGFSGVYLLGVCIGAAMYCLARWVFSATGQAASRDR